VGFDGKFLFQTLPEIRILGLKLLEFQHIKDKIQSHCREHAGFRLCPGGS